MPLYAAKFVAIDVLLIFDVNLSIFARILLVKIFIVAWVLVLNL